MEKSGEGYVKGVLSGDYIVISGKLKKNSDDVPEEINLFLTGLNAPKINSQSSYEEDFCGWESRNFLRQRIIGKIVKYNVDYNQGANLVGQVFFEGKNLNVELVRKGLAKVNTTKSNEALMKTGFFANMKKAEEEASKSNLGIHGNKNNAVMRKITKHEDIDAKAFFEENKEKELDAMLEVVFNCSGFLVYLKEFNYVIKASLRFCGIPNRDTFFYKAGKAYVERLFIHRDVKLKMFSVDDKGSFIVDVYDHRLNATTGASELKNLSSMVLGAGYSKLYVSTNIRNDTKDVEAAKEAQNKGQLSGNRVWEGFTKRPEKENKVSTSSSQACTFEGTVQMIHSGDSLSIKEKDTNTVRRVFLSHMKAPVFAKPNTNEEDKPWAFESKNHLIKVAIGKKVRAEFDFSREMKEGRIMSFYSVIITEGDAEKNLNYDILESGYALCNPPRGNDNDTSKYLEAYVEAEIKAKEKKTHMHSNKTPGIPNFCDILQATPMKKKAMISRHQGLKNTPCVIEHVFSATRFKLRIDKTTCYIPFKLVGLKSVEKDKNNSTQLEDFNMQGVNYASDLFLQRSGFCDIVQCDKTGNYFGMLTVNGVNVGSDVVKAGHAVVFNPQKNVLPNDYRKNEELASRQKLGIWSSEGLNSILCEGEVETGNSKSNQEIKYETKNEQIKLRVTDMVDFKQIYANIIPNKTLSQIEGVLAEYERNMKQGIPLENPIKKGINCMIKYSVDLKYYRVKLLNVHKDDTCEVEFLDYGTIDVVARRNCFKMDDRIATLSPQVVECELANLKYSKNSLRKSMALYPDFIDLDTILPAKIVYSYVKEGKMKYGIVVHFEKLSNTKETIHYDLISKGYAKLDTKKPMGPTISEFKDIEKDAKKRSLGMWVENEESDNEDNDDY